MVPSTNLSGEMFDFLGPGTRSAAALPMLGMGRDVPDGQLFLREDGNLENSWRIAASLPYFNRVRGLMRELASEWGGTYEVPTYSAYLVAADQTDAYRYHRRVLQTLQRRRRGNR